MSQHLPTHLTAADACVAGIDIGGTSLRVALADRQGTLLARQSASTVGVRDPLAVVTRIREIVSALLLQSGRSLPSLRAVAAGAPGITNVDAGVVIATSYLMGWRDIPLRALLESALGVPAAIENDVNLGAIGERWRGAGQDTSDFIFLAIGTGLGAGIVLKGEIFHGTSWTAGEIGYMLVPGTSTEPADPGEPGALESIIGGEGIASQWRLLCDQGGIDLPRDLRATDIFDHALRGSAPAQTILRQTARLLAYAIHNLGIMFDCPRIVLGGTVGLHPALLSATQAQLDDLCRGPRISLLPSSLGLDAQLIGGIRLALDVAESSGSADPLPR